MKANNFQEHDLSPPESSTETDRDIQPAERLQESEVVTDTEVITIPENSVHKKHPLWQYIFSVIFILAIGAIVFKQLQNSPQTSEIKSEKQSEQLSEIKSEIKSEETARLPVKVTRVKSQLIQRFVFGNGRVGAAKGKHLTFETSGTITYIKKVNGRELREGDSVKAGELLAKVDDRRLRADLAQSQARTAEAQTQRVTAQANVSQAAAVLEQAKADVIGTQADLRSAKDAYRLAQSEYKRRSELFQSGAISASDVDVYQNKAEDASAKVQAAMAQVSAAESKVKSAEGQLKSAQSQLDSTRATIASAKAGQTRSVVTLEDTTITAPFDGIVAHLNIREGDYWTPQRVRITGDYQSVVESVPIILIKPDVYDVWMKLPAFDGVSVKTNQKAYVVSDQQMSTASTHGISESQLFSLAKATGKVFSVSPSITPGERAVEVRVRLNTGVKTLRDGERVSVWIAVEENPSALAVPPHAIVYRDQKPFVFVVDEQEKIVKKRQVTEGIRGMSLREIKSGIYAGEFVVIEGGNRLVNGTPIEVVDGGK
ncbi:MAG: efflux RND transporter periplasmic adaptor subunit [Nostocaceae cyanobacterium]|nr:efflux RND transporter periplasmic adaptor subunit [Nostocaceae cyanobacterium]